MGVDPRGGQRGRGLWSSVHGPAVCRRKMDRNRQTPETGPVPRRRLAAGNQAPSGPWPAHALGQAWPARDWAWALRGAQWRLVGSGSAEPWSPWASCLDPVKRWGLGWRHVARLREPPAPVGRASACHPAIAVTSCYPAADWARHCGSPAAWSGDRIARAPTGADEPARPWRGRCPEPAAHRRPATGYSRAAAVAWPGPSASWRAAAD